MRFRWVLLLAATGAPFSSDASENRARQPGGAAHGRSAGAFRVSSTMPNLQIARVNVVPAASPRSVVPDYCQLLRYDRVPATSIGREIARKGWHVTSEVQAAGHVVIGYVRDMQAGTSALCFPVDGHVAIANRNRLIAIISDAGNVRARIDNGFYGIGKVVDVPGSSNLRITDGTGAAAPIAEIRIAMDGIRVGPLVPADAICHGRASVPNVYERTMPSAFRALRRAGWRPFDGRRGLRDCSGTGVGYCFFTFRQGRRSLDIVTVGEDREIVNYEPHC
jgi:hypothetical protein